MPTTEYGVDQFFQNAGTSPKMVYDVAGTLVWSPHNTALQSQTFDNASWAKNSLTVTANAIAAPNGVLEADACIPPAGPVTPFLNQNIAATSGVPYTFSLYIKYGTLGLPWMRMQIVSSGSANAWFNLSTGIKGTISGITTTSNMVVLPNGWYRIDVTFTTGTSAAQPYIALCDADASTAGITTADGVKPCFYLWGAQLNLGSVPTAYLPTTTAARFGLALDYDPVTHAARGLLCEPAATNLFLQSQTQDNATWVKAAGTVSANLIAAPDGTTTADGYIPNSGSVDSHLSQTASPLTVGQPYTLSLYIKNGTLGNNWLQILLNMTSPVNTYFNLSTGAIGTATGTAARAITAIGGGWFKVTVAVTAADTGFGAYFAARGSDGGGTVTGNGTSPAYYIWGAQFELGTVATSPIPTTAASVTRAADSYNCTAASIGNSATAGSWWAETYILDAPADRRIIGLNTSNIPLYHNNGAIEMFDGTLLFKAVVLLGSVKRSISAFQSGDRAITSDGLAPATDAGATTNLLNPSFIYFGGGAGGAGMTGYIRKVRYLPRRPSNAELQTMTT